MKILQKIICSIAIFAVASPMLIANTNPTTNVYDLTFTENMATPKVPTKASGMITRHFEKLATTFKKAGFETRMARNNDVLVVTVPCDTLFAPNKTTPRAEAAAILAPFKQLLIRPESYKLLIKVHSDNSGDKTYSEKLTTLRSQEIDSIFGVISGLDGDLNTIPYGWGSSEILRDNNSRTNRRKNRRVEVYIVPDKKLIDDAAGKRL